MVALISFPKTLSLTDNKVKGRGGDRETTSRSLNEKGKQEIG